MQNLDRARLRIEHQGETISELQQRNQELGLALAKPKAKLQSRSHAVSQSPLKSTDTPGMILSSAGLH